MNSHHALTFPASPGPNKPPHRQLTKSYVWAFFAAIAALLVAFFASPVHAQQDSNARLAEYARALTKAQLGDHDGALKAYEELGPQLAGSASADVYAASAGSRRALGDLAGARRDADAALSLAQVPRHAALAGDLALEAGAFTDAERAYQRALQIDARYAPALSGIAELYNRLARYDEAARALALLPNPTDGDRMRTLDLAERAGELELAAQTLDELLLSRPYDARLWVQKGTLLTRQGDASSADAFARALALDPTSREARAALNATAIAATSASSLLPATPARQAAWSGALDADALQAEADADPRDAHAWGVAAMAWLEAGDDAKAKRALDDGLLFFPGDLRLGLAQAYLSALTETSAAADVASLQAVDGAAAKARDQAAALARGEPVETDSEFVRAFLVPARGSALYVRLTNRQ